MDVTPSTHRHTRLTVTALALGSALLFGLVGCATVPQAKTAYIAVIDAGSSGTRIQLYAETDAVVTEVPLENDESDLPLASFEGEAATAGEEGIAPLLSEVEAFADDSGVAREDITVNVLGTAGMRKVDTAVAQAIYADASETITVAGFTLGLTETITGDQEALFAWADTNDLNGSLGNPDVAPVGIVEVGGASAQVAFALTKPDPAAEPHLDTVTVNEVTYDVFTNSYLGLGQNDARDAMLADGVVGVSCYPNAATTAQTLELTESLMVDASTAQFNFTTCTQLYEEVITETAEAFPLSQLATLPGFDSTVFYGLSSIEFAAADFDVAPTEAQTSFESAVESACSGAGAAERVNARFGSDDQAFALHACANATYISTLLENLAISNEHLIVGADFNGASPNWTRGFAVLSAWGQVGA